MKYISVSYHEKKKVSSETFGVRDGEMREGTKSSVENEILFHSE